MPEQDVAVNYYALLEIPPSSSVQQIRRAYRELSKLYHPDTTTMPAAIATEKFQQLNEAYATLSSPEKRVAYDLKLGYSRLSVIQRPANFNQPVSQTRSYRSSAYLEPTDRPLSAGEIFALFILGVTFVACLILVVTISLTRGEMAFQPLPFSSPEPIEAVMPSEPSPDQPERSPAAVPVIQTIPDLPDLEELTGDRSVTEAAPPAERSGSEPSKRSELLLADPDSEATVPEAAVPEAAVPEAAVPEATVPDPIAEPANAIDQTALPSLSEPDPTPEHASTAASEVL